MARWISTIKCSRRSNFFTRKKKIALFYLPFRINDRSRNWSEIFSPHSQVTSRETFRHSISGTKSPNFRLLRKTFKVSQADQAGRFAICPYKKKKTRGNRERSSFSSRNDNSSNRKLKAQKFLHDYTARLLSMQSLHEECRINVCVFLIDIIHYLFIHLWILARTQRIS